MASIDKSNDSEIRNRCLAETGGDEDLLFFEGLDAAIVGVGTSAAQSPRVVYDRQRAIEILENLLGHDAQEYFEHNVEQAFIGSGSPLFLTWIRNEG